MGLADLPIKRKLLRAILFTSGSVLFITCSALFTYEFFTFRQSTVSQLKIIGEIIADNSTATLAFNSPSDAQDILKSLKAHPNIKEAGIYNNEGELFAYYPQELLVNSLPDSVGRGGYRFVDSYLIGIQPIIQKEKRLGTLFLRSDTDAITKSLLLYCGIILTVISVSVLVAFILSRKMQGAITKPINELGNTARAISERKDYTVRATKFGNDEVGELTTAFNQMLDEIQSQNKAIKSFNADLENRIKERTSEMEMANKELEAFTYSVSHDLRAPLRSVVGYSMIVLEDYSDKLEGEAIQFLNIVITNAKRMGNLIDDLLAFSKLGKREVSKIPLNMEMLTTEVLEEIEDLPEGVDINISEMLKTKGDKSMIKQVMTNLVSNALKYSMKESEPKVEIGSYQLNSNNIYYVKDNGVGFDMQYYDKLFGVFERLHSNDEFEGTGVGLALVQRIITKHEGKVWAEAEIDKGATFYFSLPIN